MKTFLSKLRTLGRRSENHEPDFTITAIISVYSDEVYLRRCFQCMRDNGIKAIVIDNDCNPQTKAIIDAFADSVVTEVVPFPRQGTFDWSGILRLKEEIANTRKSDWFMLWDSDEIREPPAGFATLHDAIRHSEQQGYTTVNFDEYIFLPITEEEEHRGGDFAKTLETYYFFGPRRYHRANAWRHTGAKVELLSGAGHTVAFEGQKVSPERYALRHYLFLSYAHGQQKYLTRDYTKEDLDKGWSLERAQTSTETFCLPPTDMMKRKTAQNDWDRSEPVTRHPSFVVPIKTP